MHPNASVHTQYTHTHGHAHRRYPYLSPLVQSFLCLHCKLRMFVCQYPFVSAWKNIWSCTLSRTSVCADAPVTSYRLRVAHLPEHMFIIESTSNSTSTYTTKHVGVCEYIHYRNCTHACKHVQREWAKAASSASRYQVASSLHIPSCGLQTLVEGAGQFRR